MAKTKNPYRRVEKILGVVGDVLLYTITGVVFIVLFVAFPISMTLEGEPWYVVLTPLWVILGFFFAILLAGLWIRYVERPWKAKKDQWDRKRWNEEA